MLNKFDDYIELIRLETCWVEEAQRESPPPSSPSERDNKHTKNLKPQFERKRFFEIDKMLFLPCF